MQIPVETALTSTAWSATSVLAKLKHRCAIPARLSRATLQERWASYRADEAGFTLVEVIVALAMLSVGLSVLFGMISSGLGRIGAAQRTAEAASLAQSLLAKVGTELAVGADARSGEFPHGFRWQLTMRPYHQSRDGTERRIELYLVLAQVDWDEGGDQRSFELSTLRLGPRATRP
ncbi:prepilin-type N-terminal cleavage/methylation domain-containing protein [Bradyrhizobium sp. SZCCHNR1039]|uniref:type IV pilus modification PilV family protein n=1 Tax=Bradyrhizobium sp. SZCCHNR1039 TaxID=3057350 RepID=UPI002915E1B0|nr:prepilin-type N-terminal cleavage/methylation domain-containing protein [Bradyrhizobium sp. SZCCHNR1039]